MKSIFLLLTLIATSAFSQTSKYVDLYNKGLITESDLEGLIISNYEGTQAKPTTLFTAQVSNPVFSEFSKDIYKVNSINPALWGFLKDFWNWAMKSIFLKSPECNDSLKDCKEIIDSFNKINSQIR